jgi:hypothetical protein
MNKREKILGILVAVCVVLAAGRMLYRQVSGLTERRHVQLTAAQRKLDDTRVELAQVEQAAAKLAAWQRRSLPSDLGIAQVLYKKWLIDNLSEANIAKVNVTSTTSAARGSQRIAFNVTGRGTLEQTAEFLFAFYHADFLHKLRSFSMSPMKDSDQLELSFAIEALALEGADYVDSLSNETSTRLAHQSADDYVKTIAGRNLFAKYSPPGPPPRPPKERKEDPDKLDPAREVYVTGLFNNGANSQVWLNVRTTGRTLRLAAGEDFEVEGLQGTVKAIHVDPREVVIATGGKEYRIALGHNLRDGTEAGDSGG